LWTILLISFGGLQIARGQAVPYWASPTSPAYSPNQAAAYYADRAVHEASHPGIPYQEKPDLFYWTATPVAPANPGYYDSRSGMVSAYSNYSTANQGLNAGAGVYERAQEQIRSSSFFQQNQQLQQQVLSILADQQRSSSGLSNTSGPFSTSPFAPPV
jgi:hypothetical protein